MGDWVKDPAKALYGGLNKLATGKPIPQGLTPRQVPLAREANDVRDFLYDLRSAVVGLDVRLGTAFTTAAVYSDTTAGLAATAEGGYFNVPSAEPTETLILYRNVSGAAVEVKRLPAVDIGMQPGKNKFDASAVTEGVEVFSDGTIQPADDSGVSDFIYVAGQAFLCVSGLQPNPDFSRFYVFYQGDRTTIAEAGTMAGTGYLGWGVNDAVIPVPEGAAWFRFSPRQRTGGDPDYAAVQVEYGSVRTEHAPFILRVQALNGVGVGVQDALTSASLALTPGKNKFNPAAVTEGVEVLVTGELSPHPDAGVSDFIDVAGEGYLSVSGLQSNPGFSRFYVFLGEDRATVVGTGYFWFGVNAGSIAVPPGAHWFRFSPRQRTGGAPDYDAVQVELGPITAFEPYTLRLGSVAGYALSSASAPGAQFASLRYLIFGDSITETATVLEDGTYTDATRSNWPAYFGSMVRASALVNYAKSGAAFRDRGGLTSEFQKMSYQIAKAGEHGKVADVVIVAAGTNDGVTDLGDYATAIGRATLGALDRTKLYEALRWSFWTIRTAWPDAVCFAATPIHRADIPPEDHAAMVDAIRQMAGRYNFIVVDAQRESGIVREFEVAGSAGRDLADGLHPAESGQIKMARLFARVVRNALAE